MGHRTLSFPSKRKNKKTAHNFRFLFFFSDHFRKETQRHVTMTQRKTRKIHPLTNVAPLFFCGIYVKLRSVNYILTHTKSAQGGMKRFIQQIRGTPITFFSKCATLKHETLRDSYDSSHNETFPVRVCVSLMYFIF